MRVFILYLLALLIAEFKLSAQNTFHKIYGSNLNAQDGAGLEIRYSTDNCFLVAGYFSKDWNPYNNRPVLMKTDKYGNKKWVKMYDSASTHLYESKAQNVYEIRPKEYLMNTIRVDQDTATGTITTKHCFIELLKIDSNGNITWQRKIDSVRAFRSVMKIKNSNSYYFSGLWYTAYPDTEKVYVFETDSLLNFKWGKTYSFTGAAYSFTGFFHFGTKFITASQEYGPRCSVLLLDSLGNIINNINLRTTPTATTGTVAIMDLIEYSPNEIYLVGGYMVNYNSPFQKCLLIKTDSNLNVKWIRTFGDVQSSEYINRVVKTHDGNLMMVIAEYNPNVGGTSKIQTVLAKTDTSGNVAWARALDDSVNYSSPWDMCEITDKGFGVTGHKLIISQVVDKLSLFKTDSLGLLDCPHRQINYTQTPNYIVIGAQIPNVAPLSNLLTTSCNLSSDNFLAAYDSTYCLPVGINYYISENSIKVFPNPGDGHFNISLENLPNMDVEITVTNLLGDVVFFTNYENFSNEKETINLSHFPNGLYLLSIRLGYENYSKKLLINR